MKSTLERRRPPAGDAALALILILLWALLWGWAGSARGQSVDNDGDGLIEINDLTMLHNMRFNLEGTSYKTGTASVGDSSGCPVSGCNGYELTRNLDFDRNGDRASWSGTSEGGYRLDQGDNATPYFEVNAAAGGWQPVGDGENPFVAVFDGNGHAISNLAMRRDQTYVGLFGATGGGAVIRNLGLIDNLADYTGFSSDAISIGGLVGVQSGGSIRASHATGAADGGDGDSDFVGGLVGFQNGGLITASYATGGADGGSGEDDTVGGLVGARGDGEITESYGFGGARGHESPTDEGGPSEGSEKPAGVSSATGLTAANAGTAWNLADGDTLGAWDFGTESQIPALKYADYDGPGTVFSCDRFSAGACRTLLPGQEPRAALAALELSGGVVLVPDFNPATPSYTASVANSIESVTITARPNDARARVVIRPADADLTTEGHQVDLAVGKNFITVEVTAADGSRVQVYSLILTRAASPDATLRALELSDGVAFNFNPAMLEYSVPVRHDPATLVVTATPTHADADAVIRPADADLTAEGHQVGLAVGSNSITVEVTAADGLRVQTYSLTLIRAAALQITERITLTLSLRPAAVREGVGSTEVEVRATLDEPRPEVTTLTLAFTGDSAEKDVDFMALSDFELVILANEASTLTMIAFMPVDDGIEEKDETLILSVVGSMLGEGAAVLTVYTAALTITDNDGAAPPVDPLAGTTERITLTLSLTPDTREESHTGPNDISVLAMLDEMRDKDTVLTLAVTGGTAEEGVDFVLVPDVVLTIPANQLSGTAQFEFRALEDRIIEGDESLTLGVVDSRFGEGEAILTVHSATLTITDNDEAAPPVEPPVDPLAGTTERITLTLSLRPAAVREGVGSTEVEVPATLDRPRPEATTLTLAFTGDTAVKGEDFVAVRGFELVILANEASTLTMIAFMPVDDDIEEEDETLILGVTDSMTGESEAVLGVLSATLRILDGGGTGTPDPGREGDGSVSGGSGWLWLLFAAPAGLVRLRRRRH